MSVQISNFIVTEDSYERIRDLGQGAFGQVYLGKDKRDGRFYAIKQIPSANKDNQTLQMFMREIEVLFSLHHPSILPVRGWTMIGIPIIVTAFMKNRAVDEHIKDERTHGISQQFDITQKFIVAAGIAEGMAYLHSKSIIHRDVKPANIFLDENFYPVIADFGLSKASDSNNHSQQCGTPYYMAPELFESTSFTRAVDVYAYAMTLYYIFTGGPPFVECANPMQIMTKVTRGVRPQLPDAMHPSLKSLIISCWAQNPADRPEFTAICNTFRENQVLVDGLDVHRLVTYYTQLNALTAPSAGNNDQTMLPNHRPGQMEPSHVSSFSAQPGSGPSYGAQYPPSQGYPMSQPGSGQTFVAPFSPGQAPYMHSMAMQPGSDQSFAAQNAFSPQDSMRGGNQSFAAPFQPGQGPMMQPGSGNSFVAPFMPGQGTASSSMSGMSTMGPAFMPGAVPDSVAASGSYGRPVPTQPQIEEAKTYVDYGYQYFSSREYENAFQYFQRAAQYGNADGMYYTGVSFDNGLGTPKNKQQAAFYYQTAAELGNVGAMVNYAKMLSTGDGIPIDTIRAYDYAKQAAETRNPLGMTTYGRFLCGGIGCTVDFRLATQYFQAAATQDDPTGMYELARLLISGRMGDKDIKTGIEYLTKSVNKNYYRAFAEYANCLYNGIGINVDKPLAAQYYKRAADHGIVSALYNYAELLRTGESSNIGEPKIAEAVAFYEQAAQKGSGEAKCQLGILNLMGIPGQPPNIKRAIELFTEGASDGNGRCMYELGRCFLAGVGCNKDQNRAFKLFENSASKNCHQGICELGVCYFNGIGCLRDTHRAGNLFKKAAELGNQIAAHNHAMFMRGSTSNNSSGGSIKLTANL